jgi:hypothetical protein
VLTGEANIEKCSHVAPGTRNHSDTKSLGLVLAATMDKDIEQREVLGVMKPEKWPGEAVDFLSKTAYATSSELSAVGIARTPL